MNWGIASLISEPDPLVLTWVAHHLRLGAARIDIFLDTAAPALADTLAPLSQVRLHRIDADHWPDALGPRPAQIGARQRAVIQHCYDRADLDWLLHIDADEFLRPAQHGGAWDDVLAGLDNGIDYASVLVAERAHVGAPDADNIFDGVFRRPYPPRLAAEMAGIERDALPFLDHGFAAYTSGKSFFRTGRGLPLGVHCPVNPGRFTGHTFPWRPLLHFDGLTAQSYIQKKLRAIDQNPAAPLSRIPNWREQNLAVLRSRDDPAALKALYHQMKCLSPDRLSRLDGLDLILRVDLDLPGALRVVLPGTEVDLSVAHFDSYPVTWVKHPPMPLRWRLRFGAKMLAHRAGFKV